MSYTQTQWNDRIVQYPNRFIKSNESTNQVTLSLDPGAVMQAGTPVSASNLNNMERGIFNAQLLAWMGGF